MADAVTFSAVAAIRYETEAGKFVHPLANDACCCVGRTVVYDQDFRFTALDPLSCKIIANAGQGAGQALFFVVGGNDYGKFGPGALIRAPSGTAGTKPYRPIKGTNRQA